MKILLKSNFIIICVIQIIGMSLAQSTHSNSLAVVPFNDDNVSNLHRSSRTFNFGEHSLRIEQNWKDIGVAAVVWDAVILFYNINSTFKFNI